VRLLTVFIIGFALVVAAGIFFLLPQVFQLQETAEEPAVIEKPAFRILVADVDLPAGTLLNTDHFRWQEWPENGIGDTFVIEQSSPKGAQQFVGAAVRQGILAGEPMREARVVRSDGAGFLSATLTAGMRAATIEINAITGAAGFVTPGDRVDILLTGVFKIGASSEETRTSVLKVRTISETILTDIRVLAVDQTVNDLVVKPKVAKTVTVELNPKQVEKLEVARQLGDISLVLRSLSKPETQLTGNTRFTQDVEVSSFLSDRSIEGQQARDEIVQRQANELHAASALDTEPKFRVLVAARDLPASKLLEREDLSWQIWPSEGIPDSFVVEDDTEDRTEHFLGSTVRYAILAGEPVTEARVAWPSDRGLLSVALPPGMRAATIQIDAVTGAGGLILPGDRVDVILTATFDLGALETTNEFIPLKSRTVSETILTGIRVLAIDQSIDREFERLLVDLDGKPQVAKTITLELSPKQVEAIEVARQLGRLSLSLMSAGQQGQTAAREDAFTEDVEISRFLSGISTARKRKRTTTPKVTTQPVQRNAPVRIYRGSNLQVSNQ